MLQMDVDICVTHGANVVMPLAATDDQLRAFRVWTMLMVFLGPEGFWGSDTLRIHSLIYYLHDSELS